MAECDTGGGGGGGVCYSVNCPVVDMLVVRLLSAQPASTPVIVTAADCQAILTD